jgi:hypothetical protein
MSEGDILALRDILCIIGGNFAEFSYLADGSEGSVYIGGNRAGILPNGKHFKSATFHVEVDELIELPKVCAEEKCPQHRLGAQVAIALTGE